MSDMRPLEEPVMQLETRAVLQLLNFILEETLLNEMAIFSEEGQAILALAARILGANELLTMSAEEAVNTLEEIASNEVYLVLLCSVVELILSDKESSEIELAYLALPINTLYLSQIEELSNATGD